jgi:hypothetical protein
MASEASPRPKIPLLAMPEDTRGGILGLGEGYDEEWPSLSSKTLLDEESTVLLFIHALAVKYF